jgi:hypothetical protein
MAAVDSEIIGGRDVQAGGTYICPDCQRIYSDVEEGEVLNPCPSDDCPQHWEHKGKRHPEDCGE